MIKSTIISGVCLLAFSGLCFGYHRGEYRSMACVLLLGLISLLSIYAFRGYLWFYDFFRNFTDFVRYLTVTNAMQDQFLVAQNKVRRNVHPIATDMPKLVWSEAMVQKSKEHARYKSLVALSLRTKAAWKVPWLCLDFLDRLEMTRRTFRYINFANLQAGYWIWYGLHDSTADRCTNSLDAAYHHSQSFALIVRNIVCDHIYKTVVQW